MISDVHKVLGGLVMCLCTAYPLQAQKTLYKLTKVAIDAGHGGIDAGCLGKKSREKDITLAVALRLGKRITEEIPGVEVIYTRKKDEYVRLQNRGKIANKAKADLFISLHCNAVAKNKTARGIELYVMRTGHDTARNLTIAKRDKAPIRMGNGEQKHYAGFQPSDPTGHILLSLAQNAYRKHSLRFASLLKESFARKVHIHRSVMQGDMLVLWWTHAPSVLVEMGFLTNPEEEAFMTSDKGQQELVTGIVRAIQRYKAYVEQAS